ARLGPVGDVQLRVDVREMVLDRLLGHEQHPRGRCVRMSLGDQRQHLPLARREDTHLLAESSRVARSGGPRGGEVHGLKERLPDGGGDLVEPGRLGDVRGSARGEGRLDSRRLDRLAEDDAPQAGQPLPAADETVENLARILGGAVPELHDEQVGARLRDPLRRAPQVGLGDHHRHPELPEDVLDRRNPLALAVDDGGAAPHAFASIRVAAIQTVSPNDQPSSALLTPCSRTVRAGIPRTSDSTSRRCRRRRSSIAPAGSLVESAPGRTAVLVDQHPLWLEAVEQVLNRVSVRVAGKATSFSEASELIAELDPELVVAEISALDQDTSGLSWLVEVRERFPEVKVIVLSMSDDPTQINAALAAGAVAFVVKKAHPDDLAVAVNQAYEHSIYLPGWAVQPERRPPEPAGHPDLTRRELEILRLVAEG